ncbi:hypothetical protein H9P43_009867 [Blastocladiella emersonii ATCC 22665]|nr:hypothetical protein H9P43_009867 [Blastocladiella emersonii ATCC 22665]
MASAGPGGACSTSSDCLARVPGTCPAQLAACARDKCAAVLGDRVRALTDAFTAAAGLDDAAKRTRASALRDAQDLLAACVYQACPDVYNSCMSTVCSQKTCRVAADAGTACTAHSDCASTARGPAALGDPKDPIFDPSAVTPSTGRFLDLPGSAAGGSTAWGGADFASSPFAALGFAPLRLAYCAPATKVCRPTWPIDAVVGATAARAVYPAAAAGNGTFADPPTTVSFRAALTASARCVDSAQCSLGVCTSFSSQCAVDRPLEITAVLGAGGGAGPPGLATWLIVTMAAGGAALLLLAAGGYVMYRKTLKKPAPSTVVSASDLGTMSQLGGNGSTIAGSIYSVDPHGGSRRPSYAPSFAASGREPPLTPTGTVPASPGPTRNSFYFDPKAAKTAVADGGGSNPGTPRLGPNGEEEFWKFERPDFDRPVGSRRKKPAAGTTRHSALSMSSQGSSSTTPVRASYLSGTSSATGAPYRLSSHMSPEDLAAAGHRLSTLSTGSGTPTTEHHRVSWIGSAAGSPALTPTTPTAAASGIRRGSNGVPASPLSPMSPRGVGRPVPRPGHRRNPSNVSLTPLGEVNEDDEDNTDAYVFALISRPVSSVMSSPRLGGSRRGSALDKPLPVAPTPPVTPATATGFHHAHGGHDPRRDSVAMLSPLPEADDAIPAAPTHHSLARPTPGFAEHAAAAAAADVPTFHLILPTLERTVALARAESLRRMVPTTDDGEPLPGPPPAVPEPVASPVVAPTLAPAAAPPRRGSSASIAAPPSPVIVPMVSPVDPAHVPAAPPSPQAAPATLAPAADPDADADASGRPRLNTLDRALHELEAAAGDWGSLDRP